MNNDIMIIHYSHGGEAPSSLGELVNFAAALASHTGGGVAALLVGTDGCVQASEAARTFRINTHGVDVPVSSLHDTQAIAGCVRDILAGIGVRYLCVTHDVPGSHLAGGLAVYLDACCITAVERISGSAAGIAFERTIMNGKFRMSAGSGGPRTVVTVMPGSFARGGGIAGTTGRGGAVCHQFLNTAGGIVSAGCIPASESDRALDEAEVIIAAGRGIGSRENLSLIRETAGLFRNAAIAGSRPVCDFDWLPYSRQVGMTGRKVSPKMYFACGISGAQQHIAGITGARFIVAVNSDPKAAIFSVADVCIVDDLRGFLPALCERAMTGGVG